MSFRNVFISFSELHVWFCQIDCYNIVRWDQPNGSKRGRKCCYFKESLPIRILKITPMIECLVLEILYNDKLVIVSAIYRSPSQSSQEFAQFQMLFSHILNDIASENPFLHIILGDFNARSKCLCILDKLRNVTVYILISSTSGYTKAMNSATHIIGNSSS